MNRFFRTPVAGLLLGAALTASLEGQVTRAPVPFEVGEAFTYDVRFGALKVGTGRMRVEGLDSVRGRPAWHVRFSVTGGTFFYKVNDVYQSWMDVVTLNSLRFVQDLNQGSRKRERRYEFFPERSTFRMGPSSNAEQVSVPDPLDDGSFMFFIRTVPLEVGQTYEFHRYFRPDRNPVIIRVLRRERVRVPAGEFAAIVIQPIIKTPGIFSEGGQAEIWLTDDNKRMMLQMKSRLSFGSLNLYLRAYRYTTAAPDPETVADPSVPDGNQ